MSGPLLPAVFAAAFCAGAASRLRLGPWKQSRVVWDDTVGRVYEDIAYGSEASQKFDMYVPAGRSNKSYGLVVYIHGGGFTGGDKRDDAEILRGFAARGFVAAGVNYTLHTASSPESSVYSMSCEIKSSIPAICDKAMELGFPLEAMAIGGGSAGGCLALLYAYRDSAGAPVPLRFVFEAVGPASLDPADWIGPDMNSAAAAGFVSLMSGQQISAERYGSEEYKAALKSVSAYMWVDSSSVPTLCAYGQHDKVVPFSTAERLKQALADNGTEHDFIVLPHSGHGLQNDDSLYQMYLDKLDGYLRKYMA